MRRLARRRWWRRWLSGIERAVVFMGELAKVPGAEQVTEGCADCSDCEPDRTEKPEDHTSGTGDKCNPHALGMKFRVVKKHLDNDGQDGSKHCCDNGRDREQSVDAASSTALFVRMREVKASDAIEELGTSQFFRKRALKDTHLCLGRFLAEANILFVDPQMKVVDIIRWVVLDRHCDFRLHKHMTNGT